MNGDGQKVSEAYEEGAEAGAQSGQEGQEGIPLTSDHRPFTILPSDFADAMRQPPGAPRKATRKIEPADHADPGAERD